MRSRGQPLLAAASGRGGEPVAPALEQGLKPILDALYARHQLGVEIEWQPVGPALAGQAADQPWGRFLRGLFRPTSAAPSGGGGARPGR